MDYDKITKLSHQVDGLGILTPRQQEAWVVAFDVINELRGHAAKLESQVIGLATENQDKTAEAYDLAKKADQLKDRITRLEAENKRLERLAADALAAWDSDQDVRCGKLLKAITDRAFCDAYRPDLRREK